MHNNNSTTLTKNNSSSRFTLGKIKSKYLIIEILSYSLSLETSAHLLWRANSSLRILYLENDLLMVTLITSWAIQFVPTDS